MDTKADGLAEEPGMMSTMDVQQMDLLMHMDTVDWMMCQYGCSTDVPVDAHRHCCYSLWMSQQMDMLLHMDTVNIVVIVIIVINCKIPGVNTSSVMQDE